MDWWLRVVRHCVVCVVPPELDVWKPEQNCDTVLLHAAEPSVYREGVEEGARHWQCTGHR